MHVLFCFFTRESYFFNFNFFPFLGGGLPIGSILLIGTYSNKFVAL